MKRLFPSILLLLTLISLVSFGPAAAQQADGCPPRPTRLAVGMAARITPGDPNRLRDSFSTSATQIGAIPGGGALTIVGGPECRDGFRWWQVEYDGQTGWTVEGNDSADFIEPTLPVLPPAESWGYGTPRDIVWTPAYLAVASSAGVFIFDPADLEAAPRQLEPMDVWPSQIAADPANPNRLAVMNGRQITLWEVAAGRPLLNWSNATSQFEPDFSQDGARLLTADGFQAFVWDTQTGALIQTLGDESTPVSTAALSPDGTRVFSGSNAGALALWDVASGAKITSDFPYNPDLGLLETMSVAFSPDGQSLISSDYNGHIRLWSASDPADYVEYERIYQGDPNTPRALEIQFLPDGRFITAEDSSTGGVRLWQVGDEITQLAAVDPAGFSSARGLAVSPDGAQIAAVLRDQRGAYVTLFDVDPFEVRRRVGEFRDMQRLTLSDDGALLVTEGSDTQAVLNTADGSRDIRLDLNSDTMIGSAITPDNALVTACTSENAISYDPMVTGWGIREGSDPFTLLEEFAFSSGGQCDRTFSTNETIGFVSYDGVYTRPRVGGEFALALEVGSGGRTYSAFAGDLGLIGKAESGITLFDQADPGADNRTLELPWTPDYQPSGALAAAIDPAGTRLARRGQTNAGDIDVYDISGDAAVALFTVAGDSAPSALAFSADGRWLASGHANGDVLLWDVNAQRALATLEGAQGAINSLAFSPDGARLYGAGQDSVIHVWALDSLELAVESDE